MLLYFVLLHDTCNGLPTLCVMTEGGETIRQLQVECGAHIELHRGTHPNPNEKLFNIRGMHILHVHTRVSNILSN